MASVKNPFVGEWRIVWMEAWDTEYVDMEVPAFIAIRRDQTGEFQFGLVRGEIDGRLALQDGSPRFSFSWAGSQEMDDACGRGWVVLEGDQLVGHLYLHMSDDSAFRASRA